MGKTPGSVGRWPGGPYNTLPGIAAPYDFTFLRSNNYKRPIHHISYAAVVIHRVRWPGRPCSAARICWSAHSPIQSLFLQVPLDGVVVWGTASVSLQHISGESAPLRATFGSQVLILPRSGFLPCRTSQDACVQQAAIYSYKTSSVRLARTVFIHTVHNGRFDHFPTIIPCTYMHT